MTEKSTQLCPMPNEHQRNAYGYMEFYKHFDVYRKPLPVKLTGVICTIGPSTQCIDILERMMLNGMTIARMNCSHGDHAYHAKTMQMVREASKNLREKTGVNWPIAIALDTKGPEIRTGKLESGKDVELKKGSKVTVTTNPQFKEKVTASLIYVDYENITNVVEPGNRVFIDDGILSLMVKAKSSDSLECVVENGGKLGSTKGVNLPGAEVDLPTLSEKDQEDILFGLQQGIDMIFASFIRSHEAVNEIRELLGKAGRHIMIIPKIENIQGVQNIDKIIRCSDGIMLARGDLGIEVPQQKVYTIQKSIIAKCNKRCKPVAVATQMMESMTYNPRPTRAEVSDVFNAVIDGADCVMLSGESAKGLYPIRTVRMQSRICREAEIATFYRQMYLDLSEQVVVPAEIQVALSSSAALATIKCGATAIIILSRRGSTARMLSRYRPCCPVIMVTRYDGVARQCRFYRGIIPLLFEGEVLGDWLKDVECRLMHGLVYGNCLGIIHPGDKVLTCTGFMTGPGNTNTLRVLTVGSPVENTIITPGDYKNK